MSQKWIEWNDFAERYVRTFVIKIEGETLPHDDILYETFPVITRHGHHLLGRLGLNYGRYMRHQFLVEFEHDVRHHPAITAVSDKVSRSFSFAVFPFLRFPQWNKMGGTAVVYNTAATRKWVKDNLSSEALIIESFEFLYVTSHDDSDITMLKIRGDEFTPERDK